MAAHQDIDVAKAEILKALADMRSEMHQELSGIRVDMANLRAEYSQRIPLYAAAGGLIGGLIAAVAKIF